MPSEFYEIGKQRAKDHLVDFCIHTDKSYDPNWHHDVIGEYLEKVEKGEIDRLLITLPPRHGKSQLATINFPAWYVGKNPNKNVITASYSGDLAITFGRKVRNLVNSDIYRSVFDVKLAEDSKSAGTWHTKQGGAYVAAGVGGAITGKGAHVFIIDDPFKDREQAESEVIREKIWDWYSSVAYTRLEEGGAIVIIQTRWHESDLAGRLLKDNVDNWTHINFPAIAEAEEKFRKKGEPLWPNKYNKKELLRIKDNIGLYDWSALYQQEPINREAQEFKQEWFKYYEEKDMPKCNIYMTVDPAISKKDRACNSAIMVCGVSADYNMYILEYTAAKLDPGELIDEIFRLATKWGPETIGIETVAYQQAISFYMERKMDEESQFFNIEELKSRSDKSGRIRRLIPYYRRRKVFHKTHNTELEKELLKFPSGTMVDIIDAFSMQLDLMYAPEVTLDAPPTPYANDLDAPWNKPQKQPTYAQIYTLK